MNIDVKTTSQMSFDHILSYVTKHNPLILFIVIVIFFIYYLVFKSLDRNILASVSSTASGISRTSGKSIGNNISKQVIKKHKGILLLEILLWGMLVFLIFINGLQFFLSLDIKTAIRDLFTAHPKIDIEVSSNKIKSNVYKSAEKEVFHIPKNTYTYSDAKAICKAYNSDLASYNQIKKSHEKGGEWCGYGWSKDQMALFPTQEQTYKKLQKIKGHEHDCGRPGINGGYIDNPNMKFGVNCFGYKPNITSTESNLMISQPIYHKSKEEIELDKKVEYYRTKVPDILLAPFNKTKWSRV